MHNLEKHIDHWLRSTEIELRSARCLLDEGIDMVAAYHAELAVEKALKAAVIVHTQALAPFTHDLLRLAGMTGITFELDRLTFYSDIQRYYIEGRYFEFLQDAPPRDDVVHLLVRCEEEVRWLITQLNR